MGEVWESNVVYVSLAGGSEFHTPAFSAAGHEWRLWYTRKTKNSQLGLYMDGSLGTFFQSRPSIKFLMHVVNQVDASKTITKGHLCHSFTPEAPTVGYQNLASLAVVHAPKSGFLDQQQQVCIKIFFARQVPSGPWAAQPAQSTAGTDAILVLDDGTQLTAHSTFLQLASTQFSDALACCQHVKPEPGHERLSSCADSRHTKRFKAELRVPLPGTSRRQALLLLHCLYAWDRRSWAESLDASELADLAMVAHKYGIAPVLQLADSSLVKLCDTKDADASKASAQMNVARAPAQFQFAQDLGLSQLQSHIAEFMGAHAHALDLSAVDACSAALLRGIRRLPKLVC